MKKGKDYINQKWNSLSQLKEKIEEDKLEKVKSFDGIKLVTNKYSYGLCDSILRRRPIDR